MTRRDPERNLMEAFARWEQLYHEGGNDPGWSDGVNMNLVRNHILYYKKELENCMPLGIYPEIYYRDTPPEVSSKYMAKAEQILENAMQALEAYHSSPEYDYLLNKVEALPVRDLERFHVNAVLGYVRALEEAIRDGDLVTMRRHGKPETYLSSLRECAEKIRALPPTTGQLTVFDALSEVSRDPRGITERIAATHERARPSAPRRSEITPGEIAL